MITVEQEKQITEYLASKKLHFGLLSEIKDHFMFQIEEMMLQDSLGFQEAFLQTKLDWQDELAMVKVDVFSFKKLTKLEKNILKPRFRNIVLSSLVSAVLLGALISQETFMKILILLAVLLNILVVYGFSSKKMKFADYIKLSFHPLIFKNALLGITAYSAITVFYNQEFWNTEFFEFFSLYAGITQIQLLYLNLRKVNVLIQN